MKRRIFAALLCAVMLVSIFPAVLPASAASVEGDWTVYRIPDTYGDEEDGEVVKPVPGYEYTADGFTTIAPDWTNFTPYFTVQTKEAQPLKNGIYLEFRVDEYPYGGEDGDVDHWLAFSLSDRENVSPGNIEFGNNWLCLLRGAGEGSASTQSFITTMTTDEDVGTFVYNGDVSVTVPVDDEGREIYTLEIIWDGSEYDIKICGTTVEGCADITAKLEEWNADGEFFVGITVHAAVKDASAGITVTKFGTTAANATTPVGSDSAEPELDEYYEFAPIADPDTVPVNTPAILWDPETYDLPWVENGIVSRVKSQAGTHVDDYTWRVVLTDHRPSVYVKAEHSLSYAAEDFPVVGILFYNMWMDTGSLEYAAGDVLSMTEANRIAFSVYDGRFYGADEEYVFIPIDLTGLWSGRINALRVELNHMEDCSASFELCFMGMFRSTEEAYAYAHDWLAYDNPMPDTSAYPGQDCDGEPTEPPYEPPVSTEPPEIWETISPDETETPAEPFIDPEQAVEDILAKYGCMGSLGAVILPAVAAAAVALTKKKE